MTTPLTPIQRTIVGNVAARAAQLAYENIKALYPHCVPNLLMPGIYAALEAWLADGLEQVRDEGRELQQRRAAQAEPMAEHDKAARDWNVRSTDSVSQPSPQGQALSKGTTLVERLRACAVFADRMNIQPDADDLREAADEIERLTRELQQRRAAQIAQMRATVGQVRGLRKRSFVLRDPESWHAGYNEAIDDILALLDPPQEPTR